MNDLYKFITSIIIGIVEGVTEFLPISSTGHMIIISYWLNIEDKNAKILAIFIQLGSALATLFFFHKKILKIIELKRNFSNKKTNIFHIFISILPTIFIGLIFYKKIKVSLNVNYVMYGLILGSIFLIFSEIFKPKKINVHHINDVSIFQAMIIGLFQVLSLYPGFSRSGATIATGIILGIKRSVAIEFSFIISIPLLMGASLFDFINNFNNIKLSDFPIFFIGLIVSFIVSLFCIKRLLKLLNRTSLIFFGIYRFIISGLIYLIN